MSLKGYNPDQIDRGIPGLIQKNARISNSDITRELNMAPSAGLERVKKLEQKNFILHYSSCLNPQALHQNLLACIFIKAADGLGCSNTAHEPAKVPEVQDVHHIAGEDCYLVKIRTTDIASLIGLIRNSLSKIPKNTIHLNHNCS